jgi:hypothetical protein
MLYPHSTTGKINSYYQPIFTAANIENHTSAYHVSGAKCFFKFGKGAEIIFSTYHPPSIQ